MNLLADYIHPLTGWLQENPSWSLFITFMIALSESLAIIGSIVPGSVTMTAIGILAGSGVMRIDFTLIASSLGAICGDSLSYALGYFYSEKLIYIWPFKKYPRWMAYGKDFFSRHGGKSVLIGRFVGPLRSIIPVVAGIMHMKQWRFLIANAISAVGWSILYVMPGVLIGAAGHELSAESATRLFLIILLLLSAIWLLSLIIKWILIKLHLFLKNNLHGFWSSFKNHSLLSKLYVLITPETEENHYPTAGLVLLTLACLVVSILLILLRIDGEYLKDLDLPVHLFLQSLHTQLLEVVFICCTQLTSTLTLAILYAFCSFWFLYNKKIRTLLALSAVVIVTCFISFLFTVYIYSPRPQGLLITMIGNSFPNANLMVATALYGFIFYYIKSKHLLITNTLRSVILIILGLSGIGSIYLGDNWLSDIIASYAMGAAVCLSICLLYRKNHLFHRKKIQSAAVLSFLIVTIISSTLLSIFLNFKVLVYAHTPYHKEFTLNADAWWEQKTPILPLYNLNRVGKRSSLFNIQYSGDLEELQNNLESHGWQSYNEPFIKNLLSHISGNANEVKLPLLTQLYENNPPDLVMIYRDNKTNLVLQLIVWESNYNLYNVNQPLWIATVYPIKKDSKVLNTLQYIIPALKTFSLKQVELPSDKIQSTVFPYQPTILLIKK